MDKSKRRALVFAALAGLTNGLFGGGGGAVLLPGLRRGCGVNTREALATSVGIMGPVCALSTAVYAGRGAVDWAQAWPYLLGGALGGVLAGRTLHKVNPALLRKLFGLFLLWGGVRQWM